MRRRYPDPRIVGPTPWAGPFIGRPTGRSIGWILRRIGHHGRAVLLMVALAVVFVPGVSAQTAPVVVWDVDLPLSGDAVGNAVIELRSGGYVVAGYEARVDRPPAGVVARLGSDGVVAWTRTYSRAEPAYLWDVKETPEGGLAAVGFIGLPGREDVWFVRTDHRGGVVSEARYGGAGRDRAWSLSSDGAGGWYVAAERTSAGDTLRAAWVLRLTAAGDTVWSRTLDGPGTQRIFSVATVSGDAVVTGGTGSDDRGGGDNDVLVARLAGDGTVHWRRRLGGDRYDVGHGVVAAGDGVLVTGYGTRSGAADGDTDLLLIRLDAGGRQLWRRHPRGEGHERAMMSAADRSGWVTVGFGEGDGGFDLRLWGSGPGGATAWRWTRPSPGTDRGVMVTTVADGYVLTGTFGGGGPAPASFRVIRLRRPPVSWRPVGSPVPFSHH